MRDLDELFGALDESHYRRRIRLGPRDHAYLVEKTLPVILEHARGFVRERLAPAKPANDGEQTPRNGHPVFVAQHATGDVLPQVPGALALHRAWHAAVRGANRLHGPRLGAVAAEMAVQFRAQRGLRMVSAGRRRWRNRRAPRRGASGSGLSLTTCKSRLTARAGSRYNLLDFLSGPPRPRRTCSLRSGDFKPRPGNHGGSNERQDRLRNVRASCAARNRGA